MSEFDAVYWTVFSYGFSMFTFTIALMLKGGGE
jgi:hypothetical protein